MSDEHDEWAKRLFPCECGDYFTKIGHHKHDRWGMKICPAHYRTAVAAALREQRNAALEEAANICGSEKWSNQTTYAQKIRALKVKP